MSILFFILLCAAAVMGFMRGQIFYSVLYIIVGIIVMVYVPLSLKGRVKTVIRTNKVFSEPLHFEIDEKVIKVSQGEETAELPWNQVYKVTGNKKRILIFSNRRNAYILPEEQLGEEFSKVKEIATEVVEKYRLKIK